MIRKIALIISTWALLALILQETTKAFTEWSPAATRVSVLLAAFAVVVFLRGYYHNKQI